MFVFYEKEKFIVLRIFPTVFIRQLDRYDDGCPVAYFASVAKLVFASSIEREKDLLLCIPQ